MAQRPPASISASPQPAAPLYPARENTARVAMRGNVLPGWFWGLLGCLSVLGVGMAGLLFFTHGVVTAGQVAAAPSPAPAAPPALGMAAGPPQARPGIDIEPMAPPPAPAAGPPALAPAPHVHVLQHPMKLARSPAGLHPTSDTASADKDTDKTSAAAEDTAPVKKEAATATATDDDKPTRHHKPAASDDDDDDDSDD